MTLRSFLRNDGWFQPIGSGDIGISTTTTTGFLTYITDYTSGVTSLTTLYQNGPSVAQGSSGTWYAFGTVSLKSTAGNFMRARLHDGTNILATTVVDPPTLATAGNISVTLSGVVASPPGNLRISARVDTGGVGSMISANESTAPFDSNITAIRIG